jgi:prepilin-type N-terminal cleavage/methylation domain-containing protein
MFTSSNPKNARRLPVDWSNRSWTPRVRVRPAKCRSTVPILHRPGRAPSVPAFMKSRQPLQLWKGHAMIPSRSRMYRRSAGFTLIELLVVIAIIGTLAALLLPALAGVKKAAQKGKARTEIQGLVTAINAYEAAYSRFPISTAGGNSVNAVCPDFTFGTVTTAGTPLNNRFGQPLAMVQNNGNAGNYQAPNSELMAILMDIEKYPDNTATVNLNHAKNPQKTPFISPKQSGDNVGSGVGNDLVYRDPWGNPYIVTMDLSADNKTRDGFYSLGTVSQPTPAVGATGINGLVQSDMANPNSFEANTTVMIWSLGPDGQASPSVKANAGVNRDNVTSW